MKRIYHNHKNWEEVEHNMYGTSKDFDADFQKVLFFFNDYDLVDYYMSKVISNFKHSCEHIFTNPSQNHRAWLGQASVALCFQVPSDVTRFAWNYLDESTQNEANNIANKHIQRWFNAKKIL